MAARTGNPEVTRASILTAAREQFGRNGFERTTIRSVAAAAGVDPALVMHYFQNKNGLFAAAADLDLEIPDLSGVPPERVASVLVPLFIRMWGPDGPLLPLLRAAATNETAAAALVDLFSRYFAPALGVLTPDRAAERAAMIGSHMVGVAVTRHIIGAPPMVAMDEDTLIAWLGPVLAYYLTDKMHLP